MPVVTARMKVKSIHYEVSVDLDEALKLKTGKGNITAALQSPNIYYDLKKGDLASQKDLIDAFQTLDVYAIATKIIQSGEVQKTQDFRDAEREKKLKQIIDIILRSATDQHGRPYTEDRIKNAMKEIHFTIDNRPPEQQMHDLLEKLKTVIPISVQVKRIKLIVPATLTGNVYGLLNDYKESEEWLANGNLQTIVAIPAGTLMDFFDRLNKVSHGAIQSEELK